MRIPQLVGTFLCLVFVGGLVKPIPAQNKEGPVPKKSLLFQSPEAVFTAVRTAYDQDDWTTVVLLADSQAQRKLVEKAIIIGAIMCETEGMKPIPQAMAYRKKITEITKKHGIDFKTFAEIAGLAKERKWDREEVKALAKKVQAQVKDEVTLFADLIATKQQFFPLEAKLIAENCLHQLQFKENKAHAFVIFRFREEKGMELLSHFEFQRENGGWFISHFPDYFLIP